MAVDLRFATAKVSRNPRNGEGDGGANGGANGGQDAAAEPGHGDAADGREPVGAGVGASESNGDMGNEATGSGEGYADTGDAPF